jgi:hypothetical protein
MTRDQAKQWIRETCGAGWLPLVDEVFDHLPAGVEISQTYQKYAALRFDCEPLPEAFRALLRDVEERSERTCEICGERGYHFVIAHWEQTRCLAHGEDGLNLDALPQTTEPKP